MVKEFKDLTDEERKVVFNKAFTFLHDHSDHIYTLFNKLTPMIAPSGTDLWHPELWKGIHWNWFIMGEWQIDDSGHYSEGKFDSSLNRLFNKIKRFIWYVRCIR